jgi:hypothetical protein
MKNQIYLFLCVRRGGNDNKRQLKILTIDYKINILCNENNAL